MDFPDWAPKILIDKYLKTKSNNNRDLLLRLITDNRMDKTWKMLIKKRNIDKTGEYGDYLMPYHLFFNIVVSLQEMNSDQVSRTEESCLYTEIEEAAQRLSMLVKKSNLDKPVYKWYSLEEINFALEDINVDKCEGHFCLIHDIDEVNKKGGIYEKQEGLFGNEDEIEIFSESNLYEYWRIAENTQDWFQNQLVSEKHANISSIISGLEKDANKLAEAAITRKRVVEKPNAVSDITVFIRSLYVNYWRYEFEGPLLGTFARLCNVVINGADIDNQTVRYALEGYR